VTPMRSVLAVAVGLALWFAIAITASARAGEGTAGDGRLAVTPNGQQVCRIDGGRQAIVAFDPRQPGVAREIVGPIEGPAFVTVAYLAGDVVAAVCREGNAWSLRTYRTQPGGAVEASEPLQRVALGEAPGPSETVDIAVSHARGWLAITGLPPPLPPVIRAVLAGVRVGPVSDRGCPTPPPGFRPAAVAIGPADELVLVLRPTDADGNDELVYYDRAGRELLRLSAGIRDTLGLDVGREDGLLWAAAGHADGRAGLWRLDAALADGRQVVRPVLVSAVAKPHDVVAVSPRTVLVSHGDPATAVIWIDPADPTPPGTTP
jgi:hypothetical protein